MRRLLPILMDCCKLLNFFCQEGVVYAVPWACCSLFHFEWLVQNAMLFDVCAGSLLRLCVQEKFQTTCRFLENCKLGFMVVLVYVRLSCLGSVTLVLSGRSSML